MKFACSVDFEVEDWLENPVLLFTLTDAFWLADFPSAFRSTFTEADAFTSGLPLTFTPTEVSEVLLAL